mgnify:CR=1 FL=1
MANNKQEYIEVQHKTAFVTGASGFIGRHLIRDLLENNYTVTALVLPGEATPPNWGSQVRTVEGDIRALNSLANEIGAFDVVFHLAAIVSDWGGLQEHIDITVTGTSNAIELALQNDAHFIVTTSVCAYASSLAKGYITENTPLGKPASNYEFCKQEQERVTQKAVSQHNLKASIVRPGNVYGVDSGPWVNTLVDMMRQSKPVLIGSGDWDAGLVHVKNLVQIMLLIADSNYVKGDIFLGSDGFGITWKTYIKALSRIAKTKEPKHVPNQVARLLAPVLEWHGKLTRRAERPLITRQAYRLTGGANEFSTVKARQCLGYEPSVSFEQAIEELESHF